MTPYDYFADHLPRATHGAIETFWTRFEAEAPALAAVFEGRSASDPGTVAAAMAPLGDIDPGLMWEFGPAEGGHRLAVTAEWRDELLVLANAVIRAAPDLPGWSFVDARPPAAALDRFAENFEARFQTPIQVHEASFTPGPTGRIEVTVRGDAAADTLVNQANALCAELMGEWAERNWLGPIRVEEVRRGLFRRAPKATPIDPAAFRDGFTAAIAASRAETPALPYRDVDSDNAQRFVAEIEGLPEDHPRGDLRLVNTRDSRLSEAILSDGPFASATHSRFGEWFCLLRLGREDEDPSAFLTLRQGLETRLQTALTEAGIGGVACAGQGFETAYLDIALARITAGIDMIDRIVGEAGLGRRVDLRFLDLGLRDRLVPLAAARRNRPN